MTAFFIFIHTACCIVLIAAVLMQSGRGGGLTEGFAPAESLFGAKTNEFMIRTTVILSSVFLVTSLVLARLSAKKEQSIMPQTTAALLHSPKGTDTDEGKPLEADKLSTADSAAEKPGDEAAEEPADNTAADELTPSEQSLGADSGEQEL